MENLFETEKYIAALGYELEIGNNVEWDTSGYTLIGKIINFKNGKAIVQTIGCRYKSEQEFDEIKKKAKRQYKVAPHRLFLLVSKDYYKKTV